jgi:predicted ArsR family transcriptional regulator
MLAMDGPLNPYKTWAKLIKEELATQPTIRGDLEELLKLGLVKNVDTDRKARGGRPSKHYELSLRGLMAVIAKLDDNDRGHKFLDHLAKKYRGLMSSVFDLWPTILEAGVGDIAFRRLQEICIAELEAGMVSKDSSDLEPHKVHESFFAPETESFGNAWQQPFVTRLPMPRTA